MVWAAFAYGWQGVVLALVGQGLWAGVFTCGLHRLAGRPVALAALKLFASFYLLLQVVTLAFLVRQGYALDPFFVLDSAQDVADTLLRSFGVAWVVFSVFCVVLGWALGWRLLLALRGFAPARLAGPGLAVLCVWGVLAPELLLQVSFPYMMFSRFTQAEVMPFDQHLSMVTPEFGPVHSADGAPVFILQLESGNAMALNGLLLKGKGPLELMPEMMKARQEGVMAPFMWGASIQTDRGQASILCGAVLDIQAGIPTLNDLPGRCLPALLAKDGYKTFFASAFPFPDYKHTQRFITGIGFEETHFSELMGDKDAHSGWGFDDCAFYDRYFDDLERRYGDAMQSRFFGFFSVVANHFPFSVKEGYEGVLPYPPHSDGVRQYLNSFAAQDHCVGRFLARVRPYRKHGHVIIVADHSWPLLGNAINTRGAKPENFLVPFLYLPPLEGEVRYRKNASIVAPVPGQPDILPTVLELLTHKPYPNSFAALLREPEKGRDAPVLPGHYDDCQVMVQPYDGMKVVVMKGADRYVYNRSRQSMHATHLRMQRFEESLPLRLDNGLTTATMSYHSFMEKYLCDRYRYWLPRKGTDGEAAAHYSDSLHLFMRSLR